MEGKLREDIENLREKKEIMWAQKARCSWIIQGDWNTSYLQTLVRHRRVGNRILQVRTPEGQLLEELGDIENHFVEFFKNHFCETGTSSVHDLLQELGSIQVPKLDANQILYLDRPVTNEEIEMAIFPLGPRKSPSLDAIPAFFYQELWAIVRQDIFNFVHAFFHSGNLFKAFNQTFITLIPKIRTLEEVAHFKPISLCNVSYKIISKIFVSRLKPFMDSLITPYQNAFV